MAVQDDSDAFAATIAPGVETDATMAAPSRPPPGADGTPRLPESPYEHFKTDKEIARGGMGKIVAAEDTRLGRPVALKVLLEPAGDQLDRFQREALITARLQHPGIVPVYEAGRWPSGEPFFAMKLVHGRPLDKVIADAKTLESRLALLPRVVAATEAIAYAHAQRIIHRDLKPANVLIGDYGETVVIDWGLAKDLDSAEISVDPVARAKSAAPKPAATSTASTLTIAGAVMGTPAYMAPEQARGESVDQRADVFALGAMLYHLLAGAPPYDARTATDVIAAAALGKVVPMAERERRAPRDLVAIVDRAMAQEPGERYPDASELAAELHRFLTGQLVGAHRYTAVQRIARFVRKHRAAVTIGALAIAGFAIGGTVAITNIVTARERADRERDIALVRKQAAETLIDQVFHDVETQLRAIGRLELLAHLGTEVRQYFDTLDKVPGGMARDDAARMAEAIDLIGQAEQKSGSSDKAMATWTQARDKLAAMVGSDTSPATRRHRRMLAKLDGELGTVFAARGNVPEAIEYLEKSRGEYEALASEDHGDRDTLLGGAVTRDLLGDLLRNAGRIDEALEQYTSAKADREAATSLPGATPGEENAALATSHAKLGAVYVVRGDSASAQAEYETSLKLRRTLLASQPDNLENQQEVLAVEDTLGGIHRLLGDERAAIDAYRAAMPIADTLVQRDPANMQWQRQRELLLSDLGLALLESGDFAAGLAELDKAIDATKALVARDAKSSSWQSDLSRAYTRAGDGLLYAGRVDDAIASYRLGMDIRIELGKRDPKSVPFRRALAWSYASLANAYRDKADAGRALDAHGRALALRTQLVGESPNQAAFKDELANTELDYGRLLLASDAKRGGELIASGLTRERALAEADPANNDVKASLALGLVCAAMATPDQRTKLLDEAQAVAEAAAAKAPQSAHWPGKLAEIYAEQGERQKARAVLEPWVRAGKLPAMWRPLYERVGK